MYTPAAGLCRHHEQKREELQPGVWQRALLGNALLTRMMLQQMLGCQPCSRPHQQAPSQPFVESSNARYISERFDILLCRHHEQRMEEAVAGWGMAKGAAERRFAVARDAAAGAWLSALQRAQASAGEQLICAKQRWDEVLSDPDVCNNLAGSLH